MVYIERGRRAVNQQRSAQISFNNCKKKKKLRAGLLCYISMHNEIV